MSRSGSSIASAIIFAERGLRSRLSAAATESASAYVLRRLAASVRIFHAASVRCPAVAVSESDTAGASSSLPAAAGLLAAAGLPAAALAGLAGALWALPAAFTMQARASRSSPLRFQLKRFFRTRLAIAFISVSHVPLPSISICCKCDAKY